ncbi:hypothetical protein MRB53_026305 [Persea americana]|uniref:Uncharacterized protein n=1 Tax=Persea americana TaxID=3435 RepID=A0ACC2LIW6_PERAE|nr:hypothetical protein MRB53_026305 [Persea americana]
MEFHSFHQPPASHRATSTQGSKIRASPFISPSPNQFPRVPSPSIASAAERKKKRTKKTGSLPNPSSHLPYALRENLSRLGVSRKISGF